MAKVMAIVGHPADPAADCGNFATGGVDLLLAGTRSP